MKQAFIKINFNLNGFHNWPDAPEQYQSLKILHFHNFKFKIEIPVTDYNREIEFIDFRFKIIDVVEKYFAKYMEEDKIGINLSGCNFTNNSCEMLCNLVYDIIYKEFNIRCSKTEVWEDQYHGASIEF